MFIYLISENDTPVLCVSSKKQANRKVRQLLSQTPNDPEFIVYTNYEKDCVKQTRQRRNLPISYEELVKKVSVKKVRAFIPFN
jgi:hypothetical protein